LSKIISPRVGLMLLTYEPEKEAAEVILPSYLNLLGELKKRGMEVVASEKYILTENEAIEEAYFLKGKNIDIFILMVGTWTNANYGLAALKILGHVPFVLFAYNDIGPKMTLKLGTPTFGYTGALEIKCTLDQMGKRNDFFFVIGSPFEEEVIKKIEKICLGASIVKKLSFSKIGLIGYYTMGMYTATFDPTNIKNIFG
jgi:L-fucose isomerase-like protein